MLDRTFYQMPTLDVAKNLLGKIIVRRSPNNYYAAKIVETEAYIGGNDTACHASKGLTPRTQLMFGEAGFAYIYFVYGMHYMLNVVTEKKGFPAAVLIRAIEPLENIEQMIINRGGQEKNIGNGPAKLCQALEINKTLNGCDLTINQEIWLEESQSKTKLDIVAKPRIGIDYAKDEDREALWRFYLKSNPHVSKK